MKKIVFGYFYIVVLLQSLLYLSSFLWMFQAIWLFIGLVLFLDFFMSLFRNSDDRQQRRFK